MNNDADVETYAGRLRSTDGAVRALAADDATDGVSAYICDGLHTRAHECASAHRFPHARGFDIIDPATACWRRDMGEEEEEEDSWAVPALPPPLEILVYVVDAAATGTLGAMAVYAANRARMAFPRRGHGIKEMTGAAVVDAALLAIGTRWPEAELPRDLQPTATKVGSSGWRASFEHGDHQYVATCRIDRAGPPVVEVDRVRVRNHPA